LIIWLLLAVVVVAIDTVVVVVLVDIDLLHQYRYLQVPHMLLLLEMGDMQATTNQGQLLLAARGGIVH
jgi:hypothetical protein